VLIVWYLCSVSNLVQISVIVNEIDVSDLHLMTSRELTSGFDFWSRGHLRVAVMHLPIKFGADIFIQSEVIDIFSEIKDGGCRHLGFGWWSHGTTHVGAFVVRTPYKSFVMIG